LHLKRRGDLMYQEITRLRRRNIYLKRQIDRLRNKPLTKQKRKEITLETLKEVFTKDQYAFFLSQYNNVRRGNCGQRYEAPIYEYCSSLFLESRRVYRRLRQTFVLPDERSLLVNVPDPQYFKLPKKKQVEEKDARGSCSSEGGGRCCCSRLGYLGVSSLIILPLLYLKKNGFLSLVKFRVKEVKSASFSLYCSIATALVKSALLHASYRPKNAKLPPFFSLP